MQGLGTRQVQDGQIAAKKLAGLWCFGSAATETAASSQAANAENSVDNPAKPATAQSAEVSAAANLAQGQAAGSDATFGF